MTTREILEGCRTAVIEIAAIERQIDKVTSVGPQEDYRSAWPGREKLKGVDEYCFSTGGTNDQESAAQQQAEGYAQLLKSKRAALISLLIRFETMLNRLSDGEARTILRLYYVDSWPDEQIADELGTTRQRVNTIRNELVNLLAADNK